MAKEYLQQLTALIRQSTSGRFKDVKLECKHFFSGAAVYANERICISLTPVGFAVKLPEESQNILMREKGFAAPIVVLAVILGVIFLSVSTIQSKNDLSQKLQTAISSDLGTNTTNT